MAVAHSSASESHTGTTGSASQTAFSWTHTQTGTPQGVVVFVSTYASTTSLVTSVTYGGAALTRITGGVALDSAGELGRVDTFFLGSGLASGNQFITVNRTNNATVMYAAAATVTAGADTTIPESTIVLLQGDGTLAAQSVNDTSPGQNSVRYAGGYSGLNTPPTAGTGSTLLNSIDIGNYGSALVRETTAGQGARSIGFTGSSDDRAVVHLAIRELVPRTLAIDATALTLTGADATLSRPAAPIAGGTGAFTLTGQPATLASAKAIANEVGAFTLTGQPATLARSTPARAIAAETGVFALSGQPATFAKNRALAAETGAFTLTGNTTALRQNPRIQSDAGSFTLLGATTGLTKSSKISAATESVALAASDSNLKHNYTGTAPPGTVNLGSASAGLNHNRRLAPEPGAHTLNGPATGVSRTYVATTEPGELVLTPSASALRLQAALPATSGEVLLSPTQTGFTRTYVLAGGVASFTFSGQAASLGSVTNLAAETAPYVLSTSASQLSRTYTLQTQVASLALSTSASPLSQTYTLQSQVVPLVFGVTEIGLLTHRKIPTATEPFIVTGGSAAVPRTFVLQPLAQGFVLTGQSAQLSNAISYTLTALGGAYTHLGESTGLQATRLITPEAAALAVSTPDAGVRRLYTLSNAVGQLSEIAYQAALRHDRRARAESNAYILTEISSALRQALLLSSSPGSFTLTSIDPVLTDPTIRRLAMPTDPDSINLGFTEANLFTFSRRRHIFFC